MGNGILARAAMAAGMLLTSATTIAADENILIVAGDVAANTLTIVQAPETGARVEITVTGEGNGGTGPWLRAFSIPGAGAPDGPALRSGRIEQSGLSHSVVLDVTGQANLFATRQTGSGHSIDGAITGVRNQASVSQAGHASVAQFRQSGARNSLRIRQGSW